MGRPAAVPEGESVNARLWRESGPPSRLLAIRLQAFGDTVLTLPYLHALRRLLPGASLDFLTREEVSAVPKGVVLFDQVHEMGGGRDPWRQLLSAWRLLPRLRNRQYQVVIDLQRNRISRLVRRLLRPVAWSEFDRFSPLLAGERTRRTIEALGLGPLQVAPDLVLRGPSVGLTRLRGAGWDGRGDLVVLNPAGAFPGRQWPLPHYVEFGRLWGAQRARPVRFLLLGLPRMAERAAVIGRALGDLAIDLVGKDTPTEALAMLREATLVVSEDSGLMHLAWVSGAPTVGLFAASRTAWARPHGTHSACVRACELADGACMDGRCRARSPACLDRLAPERVVQAGLELLAATEGKPRAILAQP